jgi:predicted DCC family thiol-disulfide oxidoreductase YuxK
MDPGDPLSWLYVRQGEAFASLDAVIRVGQELGGRWHLLRVLRIFPNAVQNVLYGWVARNRYRLMGRVDLCSMPDPDIQVRLLQ